MRDVSIILYLFKGQILIPTSARTEAGYFVTVDPCEIIELRGQSGLHGALKLALERTVARGNPVVPTPDWQKASAKPAFLKQVGTKSWRSFEANAKSWLIYVTDQTTTITPYRPREDRGFEEDLEHKEILPFSRGVDHLVKRLVEMVFEE